MSIVSRLLKTLDKGRARLDTVGLRPYTVTLRVITYAGARVGLGAATTTNTAITVADAKAPKVRVLSDSDTVASGNLFTKTRYEIGPLTPAYDGGGVAATTLDPATSASPTEVFYVVTGPGTPSTGMLCKKVADKYDSPFRYMLIVESIGKAG